MTKCQQLVGLGSDLISNGVQLIVAGLLLVHVMVDLSKILDKDYSPIF